MKKFVQTEPKCESINEKSLWTSKQYTYFERNCQKMEKKKITKESARNHPREFQMIILLSETIKKKYISIESNNILIKKFYEVNKKIYEVNNTK